MGLEVAWSHVVERSDVDGHVATLFRIPVPGVGRYGDSVVYRHGRCALLSLGPCEAGGAKDNPHTISDHSAPFRTPTCLGAPRTTRWLGRICEGYAILEDKCLRIRVCEGG